MMSPHKFWLRLASWVLVASVPVKTGWAESWAGRVGKLNATELSAEEAQKRKEGQEKDKRNKLCIRPIKPAMQSVDWNTDPTAIPYMLYQIGKRTDLPVHIDTEGLDAATDELFEHPVTYLTAHVRWGFNEKETENLARWLKRGGTIFLDDCYNRGSPFADCVRPEASKWIPGGEPLMLLEEDSRVSDAFKMIYPTPWPGRAEFENRPWQYFLLDGRPCVFFDPNDDGCGWEISTPPSASNPIGEGIGHGGDNRQREVMYQWVTNWLLFAYTH